MKSALFLLIGYISGTLKCEMNVSEVVTNNETLVSPESTGLLKTQGVDSINAEKQPQQQITLMKPVDKADVTEQPYNLDQSLVVKVTPTDTVDTTDAGVQPDIIKQTNNTIKEEHRNVIEQKEFTIPMMGPTDAAVQPDIFPAVAKVSDGTVDAMYASQQPDLMKQPNLDQTKVSIITSVDTTAADEHRDSMYQTEVGKLISAVDTTGVSGQAANINEQENIETTQADDAGSSKITVEDALKILEKSKKLYATESTVLINKLMRLRSEFNVTDLTLEHKIDVKSFDYLSNPGNISRRHDLREDIGFALIKKAILKERGQSLKQKFYRPH